MLSFIDINTMQVIIKIVSSVEVNYNCKYHMSYVICHMAYVIWSVKVNIKYNMPN